MVIVITTKLLKMSVIDASSVAAWIFSEKMKVEFLRFVLFPIKLGFFLSGKDYFFSKFFGVKCIGFNFFGMALIVPYYTQYSNMVVSNIFRKWKWNYFYIRQTIIFRMWIWELLCIALDHVTGELNRVRSQIEKLRNKMDYHSDEQVQIFFE